MIRLDTALDPRIVMAGTTARVELVPAAQGGVEV
jgi:hypothetical protein